MKLDGKIKIGSQTYEVKSGKSDDQGSTHECSGKIYYRENIIWINSDRSPEHMITSFFHEIVHGITEEIAFNKLTEDDVDRMARMLKQVIEDNPAYFGKGGKLQG